MSPEIAVAVITVIGGIAVAIISSYAVARQTSRKEFEEIKKVVILNELKVTTLWEIYVEDAVRNAKKNGFVASQSRVAPTAKLAEVLDEDVQEQIRIDADKLSRYISSPYDIAIEIWSMHKKELVNGARKADMPVSAIWGSVVVIISNVLDDNGG